MDYRAGDPISITLRLVNESAQLNETNEDRPPEPRPVSPTSGVLSVKAQDGSKDETRGTEHRSSHFYELWDRFTRRVPPPVTSTVQSLDFNEEGKPTHSPHDNKEGAVSRQDATVSYREARNACIMDVEEIVKECHRLNIKYTDPLFDLSSEDALAGLGTGAAQLRSRTSVRRVGQIFKEPKFIHDGATADDVRQGLSSDCWFLAAVTALSSHEKFLENICVKWDERVGVYGFVFYRDGEWISAIVDDKLLINTPEEGDLYLVHVPEDQNPINMNNQDKNYRHAPKVIKETLTRGNEALFFAKTKKDTEETWLPLMEKAFAKAHGDYSSIEGGFAGEGIEDLTGGVNISIEASDILDEDEFWKLLNRVNTEYLIGCGTRFLPNRFKPDYEGIASYHAYSVMAVQELEDEQNGTTYRLIKVRNPWGEEEWKGAWSDGSKEWTSTRMEKLNHSFGDDGIFWIELKDFLKNYPDIDITHLFGPEWTISQQWISVEVPQTVSMLDAEYLDTSFSLNITRQTPTVIQLARPDVRYFQGLEGLYSYELHFGVFETNKTRYLLRSIQGDISGRSCSAEIDLKPGVYDIRIKVIPHKIPNALSHMERIKSEAKGRREKLLSVGKKFDLAHSKGRLREAENFAMVRRKRRERIEIKELQKLEREKARQERLKEHKRKERIKNAIKEKKEMKRSRMIDAMRKERREKSERKQKARDKHARKKINGKQDSVAETAKGTDEKTEISSTANVAEGDGTNALRTELDSKVELEKERGELALESSDLDDGDDDQHSVHSSAISSVSSVKSEDFEWDDEYDGPASGDDEAAARMAGKELADELLEDQVWDAICTLNVRIFSKDADMELTVLEPNTNGPPRLA